MAAIGLIGLLTLKSADSSETKTQLKSSSQGKKPPQERPNKYFVVVAAAAAADSLTLLV